MSSSCTGLAANLLVLLLVQGRRPAVDLKAGTVVGHSGSEVPPFAHGGRRWQQVMIDQEGRWREGCGDVKHVEANGARCL
jgi:hypothetical protein